MRRCVWHPYTPLVGADEPLVCVGAEDEFLHLADGRRVIDAISSWWTILHGHRHPPLMDALAEASRQIDHVLFAGVTHPWRRRTGRPVARHDAVGGRPRVLFRQRQHGRRSRAQDGVSVLVPSRRTGAALASSASRTAITATPSGRWRLAATRCFSADSSRFCSPPNILPLDPIGSKRICSVHASETAAVILEPLVQGAGGMRMHSPETLRQIFEMTRRHGVLFIADEVMTGGGRTGTLWAHQAAGIVPDLVCAAKTLTGGILPLAATLVAPRNRRRIPERRSQPHVLSWPFVHRQSAGVRGGGAAIFGTCLDKPSLGARALNRPPLRCGWSGSGSRY